MAESKSNIRITTDAPYLALMGKLWSFYCEHFGNRPVITALHCWLARLTGQLQHRLSLWQILWKTSITMLLFPFRWINSSQPEQNGRHFSRWYFQMHFHEWKVVYFDWNSIEIVPKGPIDNKSSLIQVRACRQPGDKPFPEPMLTQFPDAYMQC